MKKILLLAAALLAAAPSSATPPAAPGPLLEGGARDAAWRPLFAQLTLRTPVFSRFAEERVFPFRERPVVLEGEMRYDPARGLSLRYTQPEERILIVDAGGMLQRDHQGRTRTMPADPHATALNAALSAVLRFDPAEIDRAFTVRGARDGDDWRLDLQPRDAALARLLGMFTAEGRGGELRRLEFRRSAKQRVTIRITEAHRDVVFDAATLQRFFR
jgi:hypothetical protein